MRGGRARRKVRLAGVRGWGCRVFFFYAVESDVKRVSSTNLRKERLAGATDQVLVAKRFSDAAVDLN